MKIDQSVSREEELLVAVRSPVKRFLRRLVDEPAMAEDAESETLLAIIQRLRAGLDIRRPISFALQVAWTKAVEAQRRAKRDLHVEVPRRAPSPDPARSAELRDWIESSLAALDPIDRALLHLRYVEDLSYRELARVLDQPIGTIGRRLHDARLALRKSLEKSGGDPVAESMLGALLPLIRSFDGLNLPPPAPPPPSWSGAVSRWATASKLFLSLGVLMVVGAGAWLLVRPGVRDLGSRAAPAETPASTAPLVADAGGAPAPPGEETPRGALAISGRVVDESGRGVAGATVAWMPSTGIASTWNPASPLPSDSARVTTDSEGGFEIRPPAPPTIVDLVASASGKARAVRDGVRVGASGIVLRLEPGLTIAGTIASLQGEAVADAGVTYHARVGGHLVKVESRSSRDGRYAFEHVPVDASRSRPDAGVIVVAAEGYATQVKPVAMALTGPAPGALALDVWLARGAVLEGTVRDESGTPISGALVEVWMNAALEVPTRPGFFVPAADPNEALRIREARTDGLGRYRIAHVPVRVAGIEPGSRFGPLLKRENPVLAGGLVVSAPGRAPAGYVIPLARDDEAVLTLDASLAPEIVLTGFVRDARGAPVAGAEVRARLESDDLRQWVTATHRIRGREALASATTDAGGAWTLAGLPPVLLPGRLVITASESTRASKPLELSGVRESRRIPDLELEEARPIRGVVVDERGAAVPGAVVRVVDPGSTDGASIATTASDRDGRFEIATRSASGLEIRVAATGFGHTRTPVPDRPGPELLRVVMAGERVIRGVVRSVEGSPVAGALVAAVLAAPNVALTHEHCERNRSLVIAETATDAAGTFVLDGLPAGSVGLWAGVPWPRNDGLLGFLLGRKFAVVVPEPTTADPVVVTLPYRTERGGLSVRAVDSKTKAPILHDLTASLVAADGMIGGSGMFVGPGLLVFDAVPSGVYSLVVEAAGYPRVSTQDVSIGAPSSPSEIRVELSRGARFAGRVRHDGPLPPGEIYLRAVPDSKGVAPIRVRCETDGGFDVDGLVAGQWRVWAELQERETPAAMTTRPESVVLELGKSPPPLELRLIPIERVRFRLSGLFVDGEPPTMNKQLPRYGDVIRRLGQFRLRCRDEAGVPWIDTDLDGLPWETDDRDVILHLPLPGGSYVVCIDRDESELGSRRISSPGSAEITVPE